MTELPSDAQRNIELKFRVDSLDPIREAARRLELRRLADQWQRDTYFHCSTGRLKLREINGRQAELIWYVRADQAAARASDYTITPVTDPAARKRQLQQSHGIRCVVEKEREIWLFHNVRLHLDRVVKLGEFVELESVVGAGVDESLARERLRVLLDALPLDERRLVPQSYVDLLLAG